MAINILLMGHYTATSDDNLMINPMLISIRKADVFHESNPVIWNPEFISYSVIEHSFPTKQNSMIVLLVFISMPFLCQKVYSFNVNVNFEKVYLVTRQQEYTFLCNKCCF